ncbi:heat shock protein Hsp90 [Pholiota molesta]|nr:heat shock protein Hsp90 [Pholiota molesta]
MRLVQPLLLTLGFLASYVVAEDASAEVHKVKYDYQSDVARLRKIVIKELISNANDALEKLRLTALTDRSIYDGSEPLNITIKPVPDPSGGKAARLIRALVCPRELTNNLGTLAKSGTSEFLAQAEGADPTAAAGNLIGAFGVGFYSSFLVADRVEVASIPPKSEKNPNPVQHVFASSSDDRRLMCIPIPVEIPLGGARRLPQDYATAATLSLLHKHSKFSSSFPIYLWESWQEEKTPEADEDEAIVEDITKDDEKMVNVTKEQWSHLNAQPPLWSRDPKNITDDEYRSFYTAYFKDFNAPLAWHHSLAMLALMFLPSKLSEDYWQKPLEYKSKDIRLLVKRTFITADLGDDSLPQWAAWVKVVVDAEDLPLNVSRETLQSNKFMRQLRQIILKRLIQLFAKTMETEDKDKYEKFSDIYGSVLKLGAVEDTKNREKLATLARFSTNQRNDTSFDMYLENMKKGQKQIFYIAEMGKTPEDLAQSVFIEKLHARGYEVLLLTEPLDEILFGNLRGWKNIPFQNAAKSGLKFGDEDLDPEEEKAQQKELEEEYRPLLDYLKKQAGGVVQDVTISNRLVTSPCAIVADQMGYTANVQKMMTAQNAKGNRGGILHDYGMKMKNLEVNPRSPLIEGLLRRVKALPTEEDEERDWEAEEELQEVASILIDGALVRSGYEVTDNNKFFSRVDRVLRRSLGVSETATADIAEELPEPVPLFSEDDAKVGITLPDNMKDKVQIEMEEIDEDGNVVVQHDEL